MLYAGQAQAAMVPDYANNEYQNHELSRSEKKCLDEGYKITYANCSNKTAPSDPCPSHEAYYRSCSQEQWCRNNNYAKLKTDCKKPSYPVKACDNGFPLFRGCKEDIKKACEEDGYKSKSECQLSDTLCPYSPEYGKCCGNCEDYPYAMDEIPEGYIQDGSFCKTCSGRLMVKIKESSCEGFLICQYGPADGNPQSCLSGKTLKYDSCLSAEDICQKNGYSQQDCSKTEDAITCPENESYKKCSINCLKLAQQSFPDADIIEADVTDPFLTLSKNELRSIADVDNPLCKTTEKPLVKLNINEETQELYQGIFNRNVYGLNFEINFQSPLTLFFNGSLNNVRISFSGNAPDCVMSGENGQITGKIVINDALKLCTTLAIKDNSSFTSTGSVLGNVVVGHNATLGLKGDLTGSFRSGINSTTFIKGKLEYKDMMNDSEDSESIVFGCNSKNKVMGGIIADTSSLILKDGAKLDTASVTLISESNVLSAINYLGSIHLQENSHIFTSYGNQEDTSIFEIANNNISEKCTDKYITHIGSSVDKATQLLILEPSNRFPELWKCRNHRLLCN